VSSWMIGCWIGVGCDLFVWSIGQLAAAELQGTCNTCARQRCCTCHVYCDPLARSKKGGNKERRGTELAGLPAGMGIGGKGKRRRDGFSLARELIK
jgi:hypothetical protein